MNYIVLNEENRDKLMLLKESFNSELSKFKSDLNPILIQSGEYILPLSVLSDPAFQKIKEQIIANGNESLITIRDVLESEFIIEE